jgi:hypothetical protein
LSEVLCNQSLESGFERRKCGGIIVPIFNTVKPMTQEPSTLYAKLLGETASIRWNELQPFFARGALLWVEPSVDLIAVAQAFAENAEGEVAAWLSGGEVGKVSESKALDLLERDPLLWAVVVAPWVLVQERA